MDMEARRHDTKGESVCVVSEEITVDWRGKPSNPNKHGGMRAAAFVLGTSYFFPSRSCCFMVSLFLDIYLICQVKAISFFGIK